jgi:hypothetical protein
MSYQMPKGLVACTGSAHDSVGHYAARAEPCVVFALGFSKSLAIFTILAHGLPAILVWTLPWPWMLQLLVCLGFGSIALQSWQRHISRLHPRSVVSVWQDSQGRWGFTLHNGCTVGGPLSPDLFKHPYLLIVALKTATGTRYVAIPRDALDNFGFRTLSTRLGFY